MRIVGVARNTLIPISKNRAAGVWRERPGSALAGPNPKGALLFSPVKGWLRKGEPKKSLSLRFGPAKFEPDPECPGPDEEGKTNDGGDQSVRYFVAMLKG